MTDPTPEQDARFAELRATVDPKEFTEAFPTLFGDWTIEIYVPKGWRDLVWSLCETLVPLGVRVGQVKEKFAGLRVYLEPCNVNGEAGSVADWNAEQWGVAQRQVEVIEALARGRCQTCGAFGARQHGPGWLYTACDAHLRQTDDELLDALDKERKKFTRANEPAMRAYVEELLLRGVYPAGWGSVPQEQWDPYRRMESWGARWHEWREPLHCPHCKSDLRDRVHGPPGKREIGQSDGDSVHTWHCPDCAKTWPRGEYAITRLRR